MPNTFMHGPIARRLGFASLLLAFALGGAHAEPINRLGQPLSAIPPPGKPAETREEKAFRAGVQAQLRNDWPGARRHFDDALKLAPQYLPALIGLAGVAQAEGKLTAAEDLLTRAERLHPDAAEVQLAWGRLLIAKNALGPAENALRKAIALSPATVPPRLELGDLLLRLGRAADALNAFREASSLDPKNKYAAYGQGAAAAAAGDRQQALQALALAAELAPTDPAPLRASGRIHLESADLSKALADFDRGLARQPRFVPLMLDRAEVLSRQRRTPDAIAQVLAAEKLAPSNVEVQMKLADTYQGAQRWAEAEARYLKAISLAPKLPFAYNNLAWMTVVRGGDAAKAVGWARQAVALAPRASPFHDTLGWALRAAGELQAAAASLKQAIQLESNVAGYHYHLGVVQAEQKNAAAARESFRRALELDPKLPQAGDIQRLLAQLATG